MIQLYCVTLEGIISLNSTCNKFWDDNLQRYDKRSTQYHEGEATDTEERSTICTQLYYQKYEVVELL